MHRCLTIVEVQHAIFNELRTVWPGGSVTLARLARTCRTFNNAALDVMWETLPSIRYLIQCLPKDLWTVSNTVYHNRREITFVRPMSDSDWEIFFRHSSRIRSLSSSLDSGHDYFQYIRTALSLDINVIIALSNPPSHWHGPLVPNLKVLHWTEQDKKYAPLLQSLLACSLVDLSLPAFALQSPEMSMDLITRCPSLKNLCIQGDEFQMNAEGQEISSEALVHLCALESFECHALDEAAIVSLSKFPSLVKLSGRLQQTGKAIPYLTPPTFPSLEFLTLKLGCNAMSTLTSLLEVTHFSLREASLTLDTSPTPDMLYRFFFALANACDSEQLSHISLTVPLDDPPYGDHPQISLSTLKPLLTFPNVTSFTLDVECSIHLNDNAIDALTKHWPKLANISLNASFGWGIKSGVTYRGLMRLLSRCTLLTDFALAVDFSGVDIPPSSIPSSRLGNEITSHCRTANFVSSTIQYPFSITAFLSDICPRLTEVTSFWSTENDAEMDEWQSDDEQNWMRWEQVSEFLPGLLAVRRAYTGMNGGTNEQ